MVPQVKSLPYPAMALMSVYTPADVCLKPST